MCEARGSVRRVRMGAAVGAVLAILAGGGDAAAQTAQVAGTVSDETGARLPGVVVELTTADGAGRRTDSDPAGTYRFDAVPPGPARLSFLLVNFAAARRDIVVPPSGSVRVDAVLCTSRSAPTSPSPASRTFTNLADAERPGREPGRHRAVGQPGRDHRPAARRAAGDAHGRGARDRAGRRHQPAQRRRQGQPVLPARLQPRSRHRLRDDGGRHAGEHADARPRPRLLGPQLPDPRAGQRRAVLEGTVLRRAGRLRDRGRRRTSTTRTASRGRSCGWAAAAKGSCAALAAASPTARRRHPARRASRCSTTTAPGSGPTTTAR